MTPKEPYIIHRCSEIEAILKDAVMWSSNEKLGAHLAAYISVLTIGFLEDCIEYLINQRVSKTNDDEIKNYIRGVIHQRFKNPDWGTISGLLGEFSPEYKKAFANKITHNGVEATALQGMLYNKNALAHEGTDKLQMTINDVNNYYHRIVPILETLEQILI
ncbi:hypothetical protein ACFLVH_02650 [Chloroflexota bacterium]